MDWRPISYPKLTGEVVETINALLSSDQPIELADGEATLSIRPMAVRTSCDTSISTRIEVGGAGMDVHFSPATLDAVLMNLLSRQAFEALDTDLQFTVLETALSRPLSTLSRYLQMPVTLTAIRAPEGTDPTAGDSGCPVTASGNPPHSLLFEISRKSDASIFVVRADLNAGFSNPAAVLPPDTRVRHRRDLSTLPVPVVFELGSTVLSASDLRCLEPGDIVLFDECYIDGGKLRINVCDRMFHQAEVNGLDLAVIAPPVYQARCG